jgi:ATP-dependent helicase HrpB
MASLPIEPFLPRIRQTLAGHGAMVLQAPPGSGKTTKVPPALLQSDWLAGRKIILLAPRRLAARAAASFMADQLGETVGQTVGYRVRLDSRVSAATRIEVVTEGVLTRLLQSNPALTGVGLVIFDEFHERSLEADLALALCLDMQGVLNPDLRLLVMSATLQSDAVAALLGQAPVIDCPGRQFPVETRYVGAHTPEYALEAVARVVGEAVRTELGSILVFLPGAAEIKNMARLLTAARLGREWIIAPLFGNLSRGDQDRAIAPAPAGRRKIVLATAIAETSLTIEGIRVVVDSGLQRLPRFDARSGLTRLVTVPVSRAAADQRRGRAGRTQPGVCFRLWSRQIHAALQPAHRPEILEADLTGLALELACWGVQDPGQLRWIDPPPPASFDNARALLQTLGALDAGQQVTDLGRRMAALPVHPRLARLLMKARAEGREAAACDLAALLGERDLLRFEPGRQETDLQLRFDLVQAVRRNQTWRYPGASADLSAVRRVIRTAAHLRRRMGCKTQRPPSTDLGRLLAWAYPDRIAQRRPGAAGRFVLANGRGAFLDPADALAHQTWLVAADLDGGQRDARIHRAAAYGAGTLAQQFSRQIHGSQTIAWDPQAGRVSALEQMTFQTLVLESRPLAAPDPQAVLAALLEGMRRHGLEHLPWTRDLRRWQQRVCFLRRLKAGGLDWPDLSDPALLRSLDQWLASFLKGIGRLDELARVDLKSALYLLLPRNLHRPLDELAPTHITVPSGSRIAIDYSGDPPVLAVRLQEMFGLGQTPAIAGGRQPLLIHLLSPAGRPVQITRDLAGFWRGSYEAVKKELRGRYPKHAWPDDPLRAAPTARAKSRRRAKP